MWMALVWDVPRRGKCQLSVAGQDGQAGQEQACRGTWEGGGRQPGGRVEGEMPGARVAGSGRRILCRQ